MYNRIIFGITVIILTFSVGLGALLSTSISSNRVGGDDNVAIPATLADVTKIAWIESSNQITSATVTVKNTDTAAHTFQICLIAKAGSSFSANSGAVPDCTTSSSIAASSTGSVTINLSNALTAANVNATNMSIEQTA